MIFKIGHIHLHFEKPMRLDSFLFEFPLQQNSRSINFTFPMPSGKKIPNPMATKGQRFKGSQT
jgi:hypothetical protein